eukprot:Rhum_TRINITY_DN14589_c25_g1::Rhum_TRINITY_DN14589_c25_g1_i1::g.100445::m.100445
MKFGQRLKTQSEVFEEYDEAKQSVLDYKLLKKKIGCLRCSLEAGELCQALVDAWKDEFRAQVSKCAAFYREQLDDVQSEVADYLESNGRVKKAAMKDCYMRLKELSFFVDLNKTAVRKILKKFDKLLPCHPTSEWSNDMEYECCNGELCDDLLAQLTEKYAASCSCSQHQAGMQLDYHVSCMSNLLSYMMQNTELEQNSLNPTIADECELCYAA